MNKLLLVIFTICSGYTLTFGQVFNPNLGCVIDANGDCVPNANVSAMPFLRIAPDARGGAMGDVGIALSPDANSMHYNAANLAFVEDDASMSATYTPWLRDLNLDDVYMSYLSGYKRINDFQTFGFGLRFFSLGAINFRDVNGNNLGDGKPRELEFVAAYARKLGENFSAAISGKYVYSNLAAGQIVNGIDINSASSFAADISLQYKGEANIGGYEGKYGMGLTVSNLGAKVSYTGNAIKDFLPSNLGIGFSYQFTFDEYNTLQIATDFNKLMVPTAVSYKILDPSTGASVINPDYDKDPADGVADYRQKSFFDGILGSFGDAQGGLSEELQEINYSIGLEYWYDQQFAIRAGFFYEHPLKGARKFYTLGVGLKYNIFGINLSYLVPGSNQRSPLDNTLRFGMIFDLGNLRSLDE